MAAFVFPKDPQLLSVSTKGWRQEEAGELSRLEAAGSGWRETEGLREVVAVELQPLVITRMWEQWTGDRKVSGVTPRYLKQQGCGGAVG